MCFPPKILSSHTRTQLVQLTLAKMQHFFTIIILGLVASVAVLLAEVIVKAKHERDLNYLNKISQITKKRRRIAMLKIATFKVFKEVKNNSMDQRNIRGKPVPMKTQPINNVK